jgi:hypothetical protein
MRAGLANASGRLVRAVKARVGARVGADALWPFPDPDDPAGATPLLVIEELLEEPWASLTFSGTRHRLDLRLDGAAQAIERAMAGLACWADDACPLLAGHFLAEVQVTETAREVGEGGRMSLCLRLEALTIEE